jgi:hypothetical protein
MLAPSYAVGQELGGQSSYSEENLGGALNLDEMSELYMKAIEGMHDFVVPFTPSPYPRTPYPQPIDPDEPPPPPPDECETLCRFNPDAVSCNCGS